MARQLRRRAGQRPKGSAQGRPQGRAGSSPGNHSGSGGQLRIIGGQWRGRKLAFPAIEGLRPTTDRVRETLFNWLAPRIEGSRCLDLFAGSGALGLEALSRGAAEAVLVERDARAAEALRQHLATLGSAAGQVVQADALAYLDGAAEPFDVVFLDPPFRRDLLAPACERLASGGWLAPGAYIYVESEGENPPAALPWELYRDKRAGQVAYQLYIAP